MTPTEEIDLLLRVTEAMGIRVVNLTKPRAHNAVYHLNNSDCVVNDDGAWRDWDDNKEYVPWTLDAALPEMKRWVEAEPRKWYWECRTWATGYLVFLNVSHPGTTPAWGGDFAGDGPTEAIAFARAILAATRKDDKCQ